MISLAAQLFHFVRGDQLIGGSVIADLLLAASFGPYYYVMVIAALVLLTPLFARLSSRALWLLFGVALSLQVFLEVPEPSDYFWYLRNPLLWVAYFQLGWMTRLYHASLSRWVGNHRISAVGLVSSLLLALFAARALDPSLPVVRTATWLGIYASLCLLFVLSSNRERLPTFVRTLSDSTYAIYLLHLFFVIPVREQLMSSFSELPPLMLALPWIAGFAGSLAVIAGARRLLGERSRLWIGA